MYLLLIRSLRKHISTAEISFICLLSHYFFSSFRQNKHLNLSFYWLHNFLITIPTDKYKATINTIEFHSKAFALLKTMSDKISIFFSGLYPAISINSSTSSLSLYSRIIEVKIRTNLAIIIFEFCILTIKNRNFWL